MKHDKFDRWNWKHDQLWLCKDRFRVLLLLKGIFTLYCDVEFRSLILFAPGSSSVAPWNSNPLVCLMDTPGPKSCHVWQSKRWINAFWSLKSLVTPEWNTCTPVSTITGILFLDRFSNIHQSESEAKRQLLHSVSSGWWWLSWIDTRQKESKTQAWEWHIFNQSTKSQLWLGRAYGVPDGYATSTTSVWI